jgi:CheY-like chemotaxis protein
MAMILLVEDNEMNRDMLSRRLQRRGYTVDTADNGETAVEKALSDLFELVLMDMELPVKDGWTASREIKQQSHIPIIALTAHALSGAKEKALNAGCDAYATKPIDFPALIKLIDQHLSSSKADC